MRIGSSHQQGQGIKNRLLALEELTSTLASSSSQDPPRLSRELSLQHVKPSPSPICSRQPMSIERFSQDGLDELESALVPDKSDHATSNYSACSRFLDPSGQGYDHSIIQDPEEGDCDFEQLVEGSWAAPARQTFSFSPSCPLNQSQVNVSDDPSQTAEWENMASTDQTLGFLEPTSFALDMNFQTHWTSCETEPVEMEPIEMEPEHLTGLNLAVTEAVTETTPTTPESKGTGLAAINNLGQTALHIAAERGDLSVVRLLLDSSDIPVDAGDARGYTALHLAAAGGHCDVIKVLLEAK
ncbi:MAG: hypothetical protein Q9187_007450 [Circinaria calcarea]